MKPQYEQAGRLYHAAVEEFRGLIVRDCEQGFTHGTYEVIVTKHAEVLQHRAERIAQETGIPVRVLHALELLLVRA